MFYTLQVLTVGLSFVNVIIISFDRHYALDRPLVYITRATKTGGSFTRAFDKYSHLEEKMYGQFHCKSL